MGTTSHLYADEQSVQLREHFESKTNFSLQKELIKRETCSINVGNEIANVI